MAGQCEPAGGRWGRGGVGVRGAGGGGLLVVWCGSLFRRYECVRYVGGGGGVDYLAVH